MKEKNYYCKDCKFCSPKISLFKIHLTTKKHKNISNITIDNIKNFEDFKKKIYCCYTCDKKYMSNQKLQNHVKNCHSSVDTNKIIEKLTDILVDKDKQIDKALDVAKNNSQTINTTMNILKYARLYMNKVVPLKELNNDDIMDAIKYKNPKGIEAKNEAYVKTAIHKFNHGIFANFVGDMIINHYKPKTKKEANVIATDTSRLCFIIMQKVKKNKMEQNEWINDKSGKKFTELILKPIINAVKETLIEFIEFKKTKELNENSLCLMGKCVELKRDIEVDKFTKPILRYVAPSFHFDTLKFLDTDDQSTDEELIKIITKKKKKIN